MFGRQDGSDSRSESGRMSGNPELYNKGNSPTRRDAIYYLERYKHKICFKSTGDRSIDIGCADGSITSIIRRYLPSNFEKIVASDRNESMIAYATQCYGDNRTMFRVLDIENEIPDDMTEGFDHVFSFYTLMWIKNQDPFHLWLEWMDLAIRPPFILQRQAFQNIYKLLAKGGDCLLTFLAHTPTYSIYQALSQTKRWATHLSRLDEFLSPYHDVLEPDVIVEEMMKKIGFVSIDVKCKQMHYAYRSIDVFKDKIRAINPFHAAGDEFEEFLDDCVNVARNMNMVAYSEDKNTEVVNNKYNLLVVYGRKN